MGKGSRNKKARKLQPVNVKPKRSATFADPDGWTRAHAVEFEGLEQRFAGIDRQLTFETLSTFAREADSMARVDALWRYNNELGVEDASEVPLSMKVASQLVDSDYVSIDVLEMYEEFMLKIVHDPDNLREHHEHMVSRYSQVLVRDIRSVPERGTFLHGYLSLLLKEAPSAAQVEGMMNAYESLSETDDLRWTDHEHKSFLERVEAQRLSSEAAGRAFKALAERGY